MNANYKNININEHEPKIATTHGTFTRSVYEKMLQEDKIATRMKEAQEIIKAKLSQTEIPKYCPFSSAMNRQCKREKCGLFLTGKQKCSLEVMSEVINSKETQEMAKGRCCPFSNNAHCSTCRLYNNGCLFTKLAFVACEVCEKNKPQSEASCEEAKTNSR